MRSPPGYTPYGKGCCEQIRRQSQTVQQQRSVELYVGIEPPVRLVFSQEAERRGFDAEGKLVQLPVASRLIKPRRGLCEHVRAGIANTVDAMSESHQPLTEIQFCANHSIGALRLGDFEDHIEGGSW